MQQNIAQFIDSQFPLHFRRLLPANFNAAYQAVEDLYKLEPLLQGLEAQLNKGHVLAWAVSRQMEKLILSGKLPFGYTWSNFARPTGKYLEIHLGESTLSIIQLHRASDVPRTARFRQGNIITDQLSLNLSPDESSKINKNKLVLSHGYHKGGLNFVQIGMLDAAARYWLHRTPNLLKLTYGIESDLLKEETSKEAVITLKDEVLQKILNPQDISKNE